MKVPNGTSIYLEFGGTLRLPVNPEEITIACTTNNSKHDILDVGQIVVPKKPQLKTVTWDGFFPVDDAPYLSGENASPSDIVSRLQAALENKTIGRVIITRSELFDTNMRCIVSAFESTDKGGEPRDIYYKLTLTEYRDYAPKVVQIVRQTAGAAQVAANAERAVDTLTLRVGASVIANGKYWYTSAGAKPHGTANNLSTQVTRIVNGAAYPVHIGSYGWLRADQLQITG